MNLKSRHLFVLFVLVGYFSKYTQLQLTAMAFYCFAILWEDFRKFKIVRFDVSTSYTVLLLFTSISHILVITNSTILSENVVNYFNNKRGLLDEAIFIFNLGSIVAIEAMRLLIKNEPWKVNVSFEHSIFKMLIVSILFFVGSIFFSQVLSSLGTIGTFFGHFVNGTLFLLSFMASYRKKGQVLVLGYTLFLSLYALIFSYLRMAIVIPWLAFLAGDLVANNSLRSVSLYSKSALLGLVIIFPIIFTFLGQNRSTLYGEEKLSKSLEIVSSELGEDEELLAGADEEDLVTVKGQTIFDRVSIIGQLTSIVELTKKKGFYDGITLNYMAYVFIPRFIWPEKPLIKQGQWFALEIGKARKKKDSDLANNSINMTVPGEFYLNYSWVGVIFGCISFGLFIGWLWNQISSDSLVDFTFRFYLIFLGFFSLGADLQIVPSLIAYLLIFKVYKFASNMLFPTPVLERVK